MRGNGTGGRHLARPFTFLACGAALATILAAPAWLQAQSWETVMLQGLETKYLGAQPQVGDAVSLRARLDEVARAVGERLKHGGTSAVPAEDLGLLALLEARLSQETNTPCGTPANSPVSFRTKTSGGNDPTVARAASRAAQPSLPAQRAHEIEKGEEGIRAGIEQLSRLPLSERMVINGDVSSAIQAATVPGAPDLNGTVGRVRVNVLARAISGGGRHGLGDGYFFLQALAAGGAPDSSVLGGPDSFTPFNNIAADRSRFNEPLARGNIYLRRIYYQQRLNLAENYLIGRVGIVDLSDYFDASIFANNEARQFLNAAFVNSAAFKLTGSKPGLEAEYHRRLHGQALTGLVVRAGYAASRIDRAFTSPLWSGEVELQTDFDGRPGYWRFGGFLGNRAASGGVHGLHVSVDHWLSERLGVFGRYALANSGAGSLALGPARMSYNAGVHLDFVSSQDRHSAWAFAFGQTFGIPTEQPQSSERILETFYRYQWAKNISVTPDFQLVFGSGGRTRDGTQAVGGVRLNFTF